MAYGYGGGLGEPNILGGFAAGYGVGKDLANDWHQHQVNSRQNTIMKQGQADFAQMVQAGKAKPEDFSQYFVNNIGQRQVAQLYQDNELDKAKALSDYLDSEKGKQNNKYLAQGLSADYAGDYGGAAKAYTGLIRNINGLKNGAVTYDKDNKKYTLSFEDDDGNTIKQDIAPQDAPKLALHLANPQSSFAAQQAAAEKQQEEQRKSDLAIKQNQAATDAKAAADIGVYAAKNKLSALTGRDFNGKPTNTAPEIKPGDITKLEGAIAQEPNFMNANPDAIHAEALRRIQAAQQDAAVLNGGGGAAGAGGAPKSNAVVDKNTGTDVTGTITGQGGGSGGGSGQTAPAAPDVASGVQPDGSYAALPGVLGDTGAPGIGAAPPQTNAGAAVSAARNANAAQTAANQASAAAAEKGQQAQQAGQAAAAAQAQAAAAANQGDTAGAAQAQAQANQAANVAQAAAGQQQAATAAAAQAQNAARANAAQAAQSAQGGGNPALGSQGAGIDTGPTVAATQNAQTQAPGLPQPMPQGQPQASGQAQPQANGGGGAAQALLSAPGSAKIVGSIPVPTPKPAPGLGAQGSQGIGTAPAQNLTPEQRTAQANAALTAAIRQKPPATKEEAIARADELIAAGVPPEVVAAGLDKLGYYQSAQKYSGGKAITPEARATGELAFGASNNSPDVRQKMRRARRIAEAAAATDDVQQQRGQRIADIWQSGEYKGEKVSRDDLEKLAVEYRIPDKYLPEEIVADIRRKSQNPSTSTSPLSDFSFPEALPNDEDEPLFKDINRSYQKKLDTIKPPGKIEGILRAILPDKLYRNAVR